MAVIDELPYRPFAERGNVVDGEFRWRLGVRPLDLADWFEFGSDGDAWVAEKSAIMAEHGDVAFALLDGVEAECAEVAFAVADHLGAELDPTLHPLDAAARLVPDDLVVMVERDGRLVFGAGSVCFPNRWDLRSKLGLTMAEVHAPVAGLNEQLEAAVDSFLERLTPDRSFWRLGWGVIDSADGFEPPRSTMLPNSVAAPAAVDGEPHLPSLHVRVERETLRRLPWTRCVLFGIRTYIVPLGEVVGDGAAATSIAEAVDAMSRSVRRYKELDDIGDALVRRLRQGTRR